MDTVKRKPPVYPKSSTAAESPTIEYSIDSVTPERGLHSPTLVKKKSSTLGRQHPVSDSSLQARENIVNNNNKYKGKIWFGS